MRRLGASSTQQSTNPGETRSDGKPNVKKFIDIRVTLGIMGTPTASRDKGANDMTIYRGFNIEAEADGTFTIHMDSALIEGRYPSEDAAMDAIDKIKRAQAKEQTT